MEKLSSLPNIGSTIEKNLYDAGITTIEELKSKGSMQTFIELPTKHPNKCLVTLYAIEGAIEGIRWHDLSQAKKDELKSFYDSL